MRKLQRNKQTKDKQKHKNKNEQNSNRWRKQTREKETTIRGSYHLSSKLGQQHFNLFISLTTKLQSLAMTVYCWHWILKYQKVLLFADQVLTYTDKHWKTFEANIWDELWDFPLSYASSPSSFWWELCCFLLSTDIRAGNKKVLHFFILHHGDQPTLAIFTLFRSPKMLPVQRWWTSQSIPGMVTFSTVTTTSQKF